jgi:HK97 gp10 family phage protein
MKIEGLDKLLQQFENLKGLDRQSVALAGAEKLLVGAQKRAPVKTGALRANADAKIAGEGAEVNFYQEYAFYQEYGTSKMPGRFYIRRTVEEDGNEIVRVMKDKLEEEVKKAL